MNIHQIGFTKHVKYDPLVESGQCQCMLTFICVCFCAPLIFPGALIGVFKQVF